MQNFWVSMFSNCMFSLAVMLMGTLVYGIRYSFSEYVCSLLVAGGVSMFALSKVRHAELLTCYSVSNNYFLFVYST